MKNRILTVILLSCFAALGFGQSSAKFDEELKNQLATRSAADERFKVIIYMNEEYDQAAMSRQLQYLKGDERRAFVINELQQFAQRSQSDLLQMLEDGTRGGLVTDVNPFWIVNGVGCVVDRNMLDVISQRSDVALIESDELRNMLPGGENPTQVPNSISNSETSGSTSSNRGVAWHVSQVNADDVWNYNGSSGYNGNGVVVAILDTGVNYNHNDIKNNMWTNAQGYHGYDYVNRDNDPMDDQGHGSHCAGIVAGTGASGTKTGMAPGAKIMALKVLGADGSGSNSNIMNAMQYAIDNRANIVSMSLGASGDSGNASERQLFVNMLNVGMIATLAAGNDGENYSNANPNGDGHYYSVPRNVGSPGNCPPPWHNPDQTLSGGLSAVVCVGASNRNDRKSTFSSMGPVTWSGVSGYNDYPYTSGSSTNIGLIRPDIAVPGSDITSLNYSGNSGYTEMCGTSMATPGCAGIFALMLSANPDLTPAQLDEIIETTAIPSDFQTGKNNNTGAGRADALAAIDAIFTTATKPTNLSITTCGGNVNLTWTASTAPAGYCIYRDNVQVATNVSETSYTDENVG